MKKIVPKDAILIPDNAKCVFRGVMFDVYQWQQQMFDGSFQTFEMVKRTDNAIIIGVVDDRLAVITEQQPHDRARLTFPGGRVDPTDESMLDAAKREMYEETGYTFDNWRLVDVTQSQPKWERFTPVFLAWGVQVHDEIHLDAGEKITVKLLPFSEVRALIMAKTDYLAEARDLFEPLQSLNDLLALPEFEGQEVDR